MIEQVSGSTANMYSYLKIATCNSSMFVPAFEDKKEFTKALQSLLDLCRTATKSGIPLTFDTQ